MERKWTIEKKDNYSIITNEGGATLGVGPEMEKHILEVDGYAFKDLNQNGILDPYEDWRLPMEERIKDLANQMSIEEIAGLMLYSQHQMVVLHHPMLAMMNPVAAANEDREFAWQLAGFQKEFLEKDNLRHVLIAAVENGVSTAKWNNNAQAFVEGLHKGIPINISSDPRHAPVGNAEFNMGAGNYISTWPENLGMAATFDPELVKEFGRIAAKEYRLMGITTALSPQVDLATEPRWSRVSGTFGEDSKLAADLARAYCDGFQGNGWSNQSVNAMVKHWPGGGTVEAGRDSHFGYGKYSIYPGNNFDEQIKPFTEGAFSLKDGTGSASAVMPYYSIPYGINKGEVPAGYNKFIIKDLLREKNGYNGVVCTDWNITADAGEALDSFFCGKSWGFEKYTLAQRHYEVLMAGVDQFGGNNDVQPVLDAYKIGVEKDGLEATENRFRLSAKRLLSNIFNTGLFENPYVDVEKTDKVVGCKEYAEKGLESQRKSVVLLKNKNNVLPIKKETKVYIPMKHQNPSVDWFGMPHPAKDFDPVNKILANQYVTVVDNADEADVAFVYVDSPKSIPYLNGEYLPVSLQYGPYVAKNARVTSIAGEMNRSHKDKESIVSNSNELEYIINTKKEMKDKPIVVFLTMANPTIVKEFESVVDCIVADFVVEPQVLLEVATGLFEPSGLLPFQMPKDMDTVENQREDVSHDMSCHIDECGNTYDFAYGLNWSGVINDWRTKKYKK